MARGRERQKMEGKKNPVRNSLNEDVMVIETLEAIVTTL